MSMNLYSLMKHFLLLLLITIVTTLKLNSVALVRKQTVPTERPPLVAEISVNFLGERVLRGQRDGSPRPLISVI
jgi:hypothetical protein